MYKTTMKKIIEAGIHLNQMGEFDHDSECDLLVLSCCILIGIGEFFFCVLYFSYQDCQIIPQNKKRKKKSLAFFGKPLYNTERIYFLPIFKWKIVIFRPSNARAVSFVSKQGGRYGCSTSLD